MHRSNVWRLVVHYCPRAVEAGVQPINTRSMACDRCSLAEGTLNPAAFYNAHEFAFAHPPSREDFVHLAHSLPWAEHCWGNSLIPLIEGKTNQWPMIDYGHKASSADVFDGHGRKVGHLEVRREEVYQNQPYHTAFITVDAVNQAVGHLRKNRDLAREVIRRNENRIREYIAKQVRATGREPQSLIRQAVRQVLLDAGFSRKSMSAVTVVD